MVVWYHRHPPNEGMLPSIKNSENTKVRRKVPLSKSEGLAFWTPGEYRRPRDSQCLNTLPWERIVDSLWRHRVPQYLVSVVRDYLRNRWLEYTDRDNVCNGKLYRRMPQGSVLGLLLWNLGYDAMLNTALPLSCKIVSYADNTLVLTGRKDWGESLSKGEAAAHTVARSICETRVLFFYQRVHHRQT